MPSTTSAGLSAFLAAKLGGVGEAIDGGWHRALRAIGSSEMRRQTVSCVACLVVTAASMKAGWIGPAQAFAHLLRPDTLASPASFTTIASGGIDIVRIPPEPLPWPERKTQPGPEPVRPAQPQGRLLKLA